MSFVLRLVRLTAASAAALSLAACSGTPAGPSETAPAPITSPAIETNAVWSLRSIVNADGSVQAIKDPTLFTVVLAGNGRVNARADCNRAMGGYSLSGSTLSIGPMASTRAYCATAPVDQQFLTLLIGDNIVTTSDATLQLSSPRGTLKFGR